jgi:topoisomerase-4 subunit B
MPGSVQNRRGTTIRFKPDPEIFGAMQFSAARLFKLCRSKAYLFRGVEIRWACDPSLVKDDTPSNATLHFPGGLADFLAAAVEGQPTVIPTPWAGDATFPNGAGRAEWAVDLAGAWRRLPQHLRQHHPHAPGRHA